MNIRSITLRAACLLVELGVTATGLILLIDLHGRTISYWSAVPNLENYLASALGTDVLFAFLLAWRFERQRWIRIASYIFHGVLVFLTIFIFVAMHFDLFPD
jgi:hypothetical protein